MTETTVTETTGGELPSLYTEIRGSLIGYVTRLVVRGDVAEDIVQETAVRALQKQDKLRQPAALRSWLFRVATRLSIDYLRRHSTWREDVLDVAKEHAIASESFVRGSQLLRGTPETKNIAREHLVACMSCALRNLAPQEAATILLKGVYGFTTQETADLTESSFAQAKNRLQGATAKLTARYAETCALVTKKGVCFQCVELSEYFDHGRTDPLAGTDRSIRARLKVLQEEEATPLGPWHRQMMTLVDEVLSRD